MLQFYFQKEKSSISAYILLVKYETYITSNAGGINVN